MFDTINAGINRNVDVIICDTAGRLHNKKNLMEELNKIYRVIDRELPYSDREIFLVLDATTGQNAISQAKEFMAVADVTGIVLTKLDGTARGGVVLSIKNDLKLPVKFIGVGEGIDDLQPFSATTFAESLFNVTPEDDNAEPVITVNEERLAADKAAAAERAAKAEAEEKARLEAEAKAEAGEKARLEAEAKAEAEEKARLEAEAKAEAEAKIKAEAEAESEAKPEAEAEEKASVDESEKEQEKEKKPEEKAKKSSFWSNLFSSGEYMG